MNYVEPVDYYDRIADSLEIISGDDSHINEKSKTMDYYDRIADALENIANSNIKKQSVHLMANVETDSENEQYLIRTFIDQPQVNMCALAGAAFRTDESKFAVVYQLYANNTQKEIAQLKATKLVGKSWLDGDAIYDPETHGLLTLENAQNFSNVTVTSTTPSGHLTTNTTTVTGSTQINDYIYFRLVFEITYTDGSSEIIYGTQVKVTRLENDIVQTKIYNNEESCIYNPNNIVCVYWRYLRYKQQPIITEEQFYSLIWDNNNGLQSGVRDRFFTMKPEDFIKSEYKIALIQTALFSDNTQMAYNVILDPGIL